MENKMTIKELRKSHKMTQAQLAKLLGVSRSTIAKYELGDIVPPAKVFGQLCTIFNCPLDAIAEADECFGFSSKEEKETFFNATKAIQSAFSKSDDPESLLCSLTEGLLLDAFRELNQEGKQKAIKYAYHLAANPNYCIRGGQDAIDPQEDN